MTAVAMAPRVVQPACPPWCAAHNGTYQSWEDAGHEGHTREHGEEGVTVADIHVAVNQTEHEVTGMAAPHVWVSENSDRLHELSPTDALALAAAILNAAERVQRYRMEVDQ